MTEAEQLCARMVAANAEQDEANAAMEAYFMPKVRACLEAKDLEGARALRNQMPDCVAKVFVMDQIRQHSLRQPIQLSPAQTDTQETLVEMVQAEAERFWTIPRGVGTDP